MIMPRGADQLLLPASPWFIALSLALAMSINLLPVGRVPGWPDALALVLVFWNVHQPRRVGIGWAFGFGLLMDVHEAALLGQHALAYTLLSYTAITLHRRILWFPPAQQTLHVLPLFVGAHAVAMTVRMIAGDAWPEAWFLAAPLVEAALWWPITLALLAPQRRAPDPDAHRPL